MGSRVPAIEEEWGAGLFTGRVNGQLQKMLWYSHAACTAPLGQHRPDLKSPRRIWGRPGAEIKQMFVTVGQREWGGSGRWTFRARQGQPLSSGRGTWITGN